MDDDALDSLLPEAAEDGSDWGWATVTQVAPLRIRKDGEAAELADIDPDDLVAELAVDDRVWCQYIGKRVILLGSAARMLRLATKAYVDAKTWNGDDITAGTVATARLPASSTTAKGTIETATNAEALAGTDTTRAVTPAGLAGAIAAAVSGQVPSSVDIGGGSASVAADGTVTVTGVTDFALNGIMDDLTPGDYRITGYLSCTTAAGVILKLRKAGTSHSTGYYQIYQFTSTSAWGSPIANVGSFQNISSWRLAFRGDNAFDASVKRVGDSYGNREFLCTVGGDRTNDPLLLYTMGRTAQITGPFDGLTFITNGGGIMSGYVKVVKVS